MANESNGTPEALEAMRAKLRDLPPKAPSRMTHRQIVEALEAEIRAALTRGYTLADIAGIYEELGEIRPSTLQSYLRDLERLRAAARPRRAAAPRPAASSPSLRAEDSSAPPAPAFLPVPPVSEES